MAYLIMSAFYKKAPPFVSVAHIKRSNGANVLMFACGVLEALSGLSPRPPSHTGNPSHTVRPTASLALDLS